MENNHLTTHVSDIYIETFTNLIKLNQKNNEFALTVTVPEVAKLLRINTTKAYEMVKTGTIPSRKFGKRIVIPITSLIRWLDDVA